MSDQMFHDPKAFDELGRVIPHVFVSGAPEYAACLACGGAYQAKVNGKPIHHG